MPKIDLNAEKKQREMMLVSDKLMLTPDEAKEMLNIGRNTLIAYTEAGFIPFTWSGSKRLYPRWGLEAFAYNFAFKRIDSQTLEVQHVDNDYLELIERLKKENQGMKSKLEVAKKALF